MLESTDILKGHKGQVWCVCWSPDGKQLASCGSDKTVRIWQQNQDSKKFECIDVIEGKHNRTVRCIDFSPNGIFLACSSFDGTATVWQRKENPTLTTNATTATSATTSLIQENSVNVSGNDIKSVHDMMDDLEDESSSSSNLFQYVTTLEGHENEVKSIAWDKTGQLLATCGRDKTVWIWEAIDLGAEQFDCVSVLNGHTQDVKMVKWHPNKEMLISSSYDDTIRVWVEDIDDWSCADAAMGHSSTVWSVAFNYDGTLMASVGDDKLLIIWKFYEHDNSENVFVPPDKKFIWKEIQRIQGNHKRTIYSVDWSPLNHMIATASGDDALRIFGPSNTNAMVNTNTTISNAQNSQFELKYEILNAHSADLNCVKWNPKISNMLATASDDGTLKIWNLSA